jgi:pimeloyl-ACP methyl ester carboxylesterase
MFEEMTRQPEVIAAAILVDQTFQDYRDVIENSFLVPTLVCYGEKSPQPRASMQWIARTALNGEERLFEDCGHCLFLEAPEEFNHAVGAFVDRAAAG